MRHIVQYKLVLIFLIIGIILLNLAPKGCWKEDEDDDFDTGSSAFDIWTKTSVINTPSAREHHTAVWTGSEMIVWGGTDNNQNPLNTGAKYTPPPQGGVDDTSLIRIPTGTWTSVSTNGTPAIRTKHTAVWTSSGSEPWRNKMIIWGGRYDSTVLNTGAKYDPSINTWTSITTSGAPIARKDHTAVWTDSKMIIWGGVNASDNYLNSGSIYDPSIDTWSAAITSTNAPSLRGYYSAVWSDSELIIWGGSNELLQALNTGARYDPSIDTWTAITATGAPVSRTSHSAIWIGSEMIIWGGVDAGGESLNTGTRYNPSNDTWTPITTVNAPAARSEFSAIWTGSEMFIWGGIGETGLVYSGAKYKPSTDTWTTINPSCTPSARKYHSAIWTGNEMIIWGGWDGSNCLNTGSRYRP